MNSQGAASRLIGAIPTGLLVYSYRKAGYTKTVIVHFRDDEAEVLFQTGHSRRFHPIEKVAKRKLDYLNSAVDLNDLRVPPGNRLEALQGDRAGQHSIRVNDQYRVCFRWTDEGVHDVEITDYH